ncbi:MAG: A/G-specific adenine glycosylase [Panacagrimonas sp.]
MPRKRFASRLLAWFDQHGRQNLPWQHPRTAYRVWLSEIMLQQTQVAAVVPYFERFVGRFPDIEPLAAAEVDEVMQYWAGLGYYARARNLHRTAKQIMEQHEGAFPRDFDAVSALPGIGRSTAGAILSQAFGQRFAILDGNVRRTLARHRGIEGWPGKSAVQTRLWAQAEQSLPHQRLADYSQAIMDLGNLICTPRKPECDQCPVSSDCVAHQQGLVRQLPTPKPKRHRPLRKQWLLLLEAEGQGLLLERRPPAGIWGGLWSPPTTPSDQHWQAELQRLGYLATASEALAPIQHAFTHFELELRPIRIGVKPQTGLREPANHRWFNISHPKWPALPKPVSRLFEEIYPCHEPFTASS